MKKFKIILTIILFILSCSPVSAQQNKQELGETNIKTVKYFEVQVDENSQNPFTKTVTLTVTIKALLDSPKTEISWDIPSTLEANLKSKRFYSLNEGDSLSQKITIKPKTAGTNNITASVISWQHDTNYTNSSTRTLTFDKDLEIIPKTSEYNTSVLIMYIGFLLLAGIMIFLIIKVVKKGTQKAKKWLTPPV